MSVQCAHKHPPRRHFRTAPYLQHPYLQQDDLMKEVPSRVGPLRDLWDLLVSVSDVPYWYILRVGTSCFRYIINAPGLAMGPGIHRREGMPAQGAGATQRHSIVFFPRCR